MCDVVYIEEQSDPDADSEHSAGERVKKIEVIDPASWEANHMVFHCDVEDAEAVVRVVEEAH